MALCKQVHGPDTKSEALWAMSWRVWGFDHCHGLKAGVAHRLEYYISVWYCGWTLEGFTVQLSYPNFPLVYPNWGTVTRSLSSAASVFGMGYRTAAGI